jgi:hypothetical protein
MAVSVEESPVRVVITYHAAPGRRDQVAGLLADLGRAMESLLLKRGHRTVSEDPTRPGRFKETLTFLSESARISFDAFHLRSRAVMAVNASLEDLLEPERCDFQVFRDAG